MKIHVKHILVKHEYEAADLLKKISSGESFEKIAMRFSMCPSSESGGDLGEVHIKRLNEDFVEAALQLKPLEISKPVRTSFGYHLILRLK